ncbi:S4 domain-containing protein [Oceanithermus desulfurans]|uniref:RNA-binding protein n=2 Tax=Oceanithermus desulfurans TaxID=227924 RepID=A0A511RK66_9DEIN|nr:S4 domain-containing protein [Oceanithermus desulfurans]MBB6030550.1 RNA-binding protein YlmH [Oceanithermus desulfurans]GEM90040.1 RNA-binding protein [Oceanithermus desulfurans NBRC 100063]
MNLDDLVKKARGGRVVASGFLDPEAQEALRTLAAHEGLGLAWFGGLPAAERRLGVLHPPEVPEVSDPTWVGWLAAEDPERAAARLRRTLDAGELGDVRPTPQGVLFATTRAAKARLAAAGLAAAEPPEERRPRERRKTRTLVVPSLRVDVVGAKGLGVSRSYFAKGVKAGKVRLRGRVAGAGDEVREGDTLIAEGLGQVTLVRVVGRTTRGNYKVELTAEK